MGYVLDAHQVQTPNEHDLCSGFICFRWIMKEWSRNCSGCKSLTDNHNQRTGHGKLKASLLNVGYSLWHQSS